MLVSAAAGIGFYGAVEATPLASRYLLCHHEDGDIKEYVTDHLEEIINQQEEAMGIQFPKRPTIKFRLPVEWRLDGSAMNISGIYRDRENTIYLNSGLLSLPIPDGGDIIAASLTNSELQSVLRTMYHELGHFYCDAIAEEAGFGDWPKIYPLGKDENIIGLRLVSEGIAEYMERKTCNSNLEDTFSDEDWPKDTRGFFLDGELDNSVLYQGGYHLVKPILDKYGQAGILYLMKAPPQEDDVLRLPQYQQRLMGIIKIIRDNDLESSILPRL